MGAHRRRVVLRYKKKKNYFCERCLINEIRLLCTQTYVLCVLVRMAILHNYIHYAHLCPNVVPLRESCVQYCITAGQQQNSAGIRDPAATATGTSNGTLNPLTLLTTLQPFMQTPSSLSIIL